MISDDELLAGLTFLSRHAAPEFRLVIEKTVNECRDICAANALDKLRAQSAEDLELSVRSSVALKRMGFKTIGDVEEFAVKSDDEALSLGKHFHFAKKSLKEVRGLLDHLGLKAVPNVTDAVGGFIDSGGQVNRSGRVG